VFPRRLQAPAQLKHNHPRRAHVHSLAISHHALFNMSYRASEMTFNSINFAILFTVLVVLVIVIVMYSY